jgi:quercetin dioxygenase-like cupin family protein
LGVGEDLRRAGFFTSHQLLKSKVPARAFGRDIIHFLAQRLNDFGVLGCAEATLPMPIVDITKLRVTERLPGWRGRYFHTASMTFAHYDFRSGASIHEHFHPEEEVYEVIEGELEITIDGQAQRLRPGLAAVVPSNARHSVKALTDGRVIIVDHPARPEFS